MLSSNLLAPTFCRLLALLALASSAFGQTYYFNRNAQLTGDRDFTRAHNWTQNANGTGSYPTSTTDDDFTSNSLSSKWTLRDLDNWASTVVNTTTNDNQLTMQVRGADVWGATNEFAVLYRKDITNNFDVSVKVVSQSGGSAWAKAGIMAGCDLNDLACGGYLILAVTPSHAVNLQWVVDGTPNQYELDGSSAETGTSTLPKYLRLVKTGYTYTGWYKDNEGDAWTQVGTSVTPYWGELDSHVGLFANSNNASGTATWVFDDWKGGTAISGTGYTLSLAGTLNGDANAVVSSDVSAASIDFSSYSGTLNFGGVNGLFATYYDNEDFTGTTYSRVDSMVNFDWGAGSPDASIGADNWGAVWEGYIVAPVTGTYTFYTTDDDAARLYVNNVMVVEDWVSGSTTAEKTSSTVSLTAGVPVPIKYWYLEYTGNANARLRWQCSGCSPAVAKELVPKRSLFAGRMAFTGNVNMGSSGTFTAADGLIEFTGSSGTQVFTPRSGQTMPRLLHSGAGTLQLATNNLSTLGYYQSAGTLDFNGRTLTTVASAPSRGDFQLWNGTSSSFANLGGSTLTIVGAASFEGQSGNLVNMNPGSAWTLTTTGQLTADYATIGNCNASAGDSGRAYKSVDAGSNSKWKINGGTFYWHANSVISSTNFKNAYNWTNRQDGKGYRPETSKDDKFEDQTLNGNWTFRDVDGDEAHGAYMLSGGQLQLSGQGGDVYGGTNEWVGVYRTDITGDYFDVTVKLMSQTNTDGWAKAGILMVNDATNFSTGGLAFMGITPGNGWDFQWDGAGGTQGQIESGTATGSGTPVTFPCWVRLVRNGTSVTGWYKTAEGNAWTQVGSAQTAIQGLANGTSSHIALFMTTHNGGQTGITVFDDFQAGGLTNTVTDNDLSFDGTGTNDNANATMNSSLTVKSIDFSNYTGTFDFGSSTLTISGGNAFFSSTMGLTPGTGALAFDAAWGVNSTFTPKSGATFPAILKSNANSMDLSTNALITPSITLTGGSITWGTGLTHQIGTLTTSGGSSMTFNNSTVQITSGNADLSGIPTLNANTGILQFTGTSGTQVFTTRSGTTYPNVIHSGAGTLQLASNNLTALSFSQSAGVLDFNGRNITTNSSGNFTLTNGNASSFVNLGGRTITVAGNASFSGSAGNLINMNPTSAWTVAATGTLTADYAYLANSTASVSGGVATNSVDGGGNVNWNAAATDFSAWSYNGRIQFNTTASGANVAGSVSNFPLLLRFTSSNFTFTQAESDGSDLRFADPDGTNLRYQIERWDATNKAGEVWVLVPQVDGNSDKDYITMYWGNASAAAASSGSDVFSTNAGYIGVWHLNNSLNDATSNANNLGNNGGTTNDTGVSADGRYFNANNLNISNNSSLNPTSAITISAWVRPTDQGVGNRRILQKSGGDDQYRLIVEPAQVRWHLYGLTSGATLTYAGVPSPGVWHLVTATYDGSTSKIFIDGVAVASQAASGSINTTTNGIDVGGKPGSAASGDRWQGWMDEVILSSSAMSADRIKLAYETQKPRTAVLTYPNSSFANWSYNTRIHVNTSATGANIASNQSNYPLLVRLTAANFDFSQANSNGSDIRFADSAGNFMAYEVERWDATNKAADIWVLVPTLYGNNNSQWFRMYWGNRNASSLSSGSSVFLSTNGYVGVYHLHEDGSTTANAYQDASGYRNRGTGIALTNASDVSGLVGTGHNFAAASNQGISVPHHVSQHNNGALTVQAWVNSTSQAAYKRIVGKPFSSGASPWSEYDLELDATGTKVAFSLTIAGTEAGYQGTTVMSNGSWYMVAGTYDGAAQKVFTNGVAEYSGARSGSISDYAQPLAIGKYYHDNGSNWDGKIDEVRVSNVARSADWLKLDYETMKANASVVTVGARSPAYAKSVQFNFNTTGSGGGANVSGNVTNIPMLVRLSSTNFDFTAVRDDGADIRFIDKSGAALYHEVVEWDKANKAGKVWVKVPQVDGNSTADFITAYYGCASCSGNPWAKPDSVWSGYTSVFHLAAPETRAVDAAALGNHGSYVSSQPQIDGVVTKNATLFDGASANSRIDIPNESNYDYTTNVSVGAWIKVSSWLTDWAPVVNHGDANWRLHRAGSGNNMGFAVSKSGGNYDSYSSTSVNDGSWHHVVGVYDGANVKIYVDGVVGGTSPALTGSLDNDNNAVSIAYNSTVTSRRWNGAISEVRLSNNSAVLSADFIKLSYENQKASSTMISTPVTKSSFASSKIFRFNTTSTGANVSGDVYDFPLLIRITDAAITDTVQPGAPDIRFLDADGVTWLDYQVERWNAGLNKAEVWVKVPKIDGNSAGDFITMYYDDVTNGTVPDGSCGSCVFAPANGFSGVWHLNEDGNNSANGYADATGNGNHGTGTNIDGSDDVTAQIGIGHSINTAADVENIAAGTAAGSGMMQTVSFWMKADTLVQMAPVDKNPNDASGVGWTFKTRPDGALWYRLGSESARTDITKASAYSVGAWVHVTGTFNGYTGAGVLYLNGASAASNAAVTQRVNNSTTTLRFGQPSAAQTDEEFRGTLDEIQISSVVRDSNWVKLAYQTQRSDATPLFNPSQIDFEASVKLKFNTTRTGANVMGDVENFPLLVRFTDAAIVDAVQNDWDDIRFLDNDGKTWLNYQVERWDKTNNLAEVWVLVPKIDGNSDQDFITMWYDDDINGSVPNGQCASCVFSTSNGFQAVLHLNEDGNTSAGGYADATGSGNTGTGTALTNASDVTGMIGFGTNFNGSTQYLSMAGSSYPTGTNPRTMCAWAQSTSTGLYVLAGYGTKNATSAVFGLADWSGNGTYGGWIDGGSEPTGNYAHNTNWHYHCATYDGSTVRHYIDSAQTGSLAATLSTTGGSLVVGARMGDFGVKWPGIIDEFTVSTVARSADWIRLSYETQRPASGNKFWSTRPGPNNKAVLTALPGAGAISLSWNSSLTDSANADSIGIWVKYSGTLDSVGAAGQSKVAVLHKSDTTYSYPATYPGTYVFGLAVRNSNVKWSPFTALSIDTVVQQGDNGMNDTIYVDSALGSDSYTCAEARNPATPFLTIEPADDCDGNATDTLVIRVMAGTYTGSGNDEIDAGSSDPVILTSFDNRTRAVFAAAGAARTSASVNYYPTLYVWGNAHVRNLDVMAGTNGGVGIMTTGSENQVAIEGCRIYNNGATQNAYGIYLVGSAPNNFHVANNLIYQPTTYGIWSQKDNWFNFVNNTLVGTGAGGTKGIYIYQTAFSANGTITNNILYNWDTGIETISNTAATGVISNNLFYLVTSTKLVVNCTDDAKITADPRFYSMNIADRNAFKLLPGSAAIDAGTSATGGGFARTTPDDLWGTARPQGGTPDIGAYEGTGYTPNPTADFDTLTNTVSGNTVIVKNSKWKLVWDMARGGGITGFYDMTGDSTANLVASSNLLFDIRIDGDLASTKTSNTIAPYFQERSRSRSVVRQRLALSASKDLIVTYAVHASGHVYIQSEISNLGSSLLDVDVVDYYLKLGSASSVTKSAGSLANLSFKSGYGYLTTATKDALLAVTRDLDEGARNTSETWSQAGSVAGALDSVGWSVTDMTDIARNMKRHHHFLLYVGDGSLDNGKASSIAGDAYNPAVPSISAGSLLHEKSWQDRLGGHWPMNEGVGDSTKDRSINYVNNAALTSTSWVTGKAGSGLRFTTSSVGVVADNDALEAGNYRMFMLWVKPDFGAMGSDAYILSKGQNTTDGWHFRRASGANKIKFTVGSVSVTSPTLTTNTWVHLAGFIDVSRGISLYVNGVLDTASSTAPSPVVNASALRMGENAGTGAPDRFAGDIDDVRIYHVGLSMGQLQAIVAQGFSAQYGHYHLRADNNNRVVATLNTAAAQTRVQPTFRIDNWWAPKTPKYVYVNGVRLTPNVDFVVDSVPNASNTWDFGPSLILQVNRILTGTDQTLFVDDNDSSGYLGATAAMKALTISTTANDKISIQNFSGSTFGSATSGQWALEMDLNGWTSWNSARLVDSGFGGFNSWKAAAISPNLAIGSATQLAPIDLASGRSLLSMKFDNSGSTLYAGGAGYASPANLSYTLTDSSATRLSLVLDTMSMQNSDGTFKLRKRWTVYPTGRIIGSWSILSSTFNFDDVGLDFQGRYNASPTAPWGNTYGQTNARTGWMGGDLDFHSMVGGILSIKNATSLYSTGAATVTGVNSALTGNSSGADYRRSRLNLVQSLFTSANNTITVNFALDISKDFTDSATADSLIKDLQTPAAITALGAGTANPSDALDFNTSSPDGFAEGDGAYVYTASGSGTAHFKFVNTVTHFNPAFRLKGWTFANLPEFVIVDNQTLTRGYQYNAYLSSKNSELILQFNKTFAPGNHVFYISHKTGLAVTLNRFEAKGGEGADTLAWETQSEFENLGFNVWRRVAPDQDLPQDLAATGEAAAGAGIANALLGEAKAQARAAAKATATVDGVPTEDSLVTSEYTPEQLKAMGYVRINAKLIPGAKGGSSATTSAYQYVDRGAAYGVAYDYLLEAVDFSGSRVQYGPRRARALNPLETALQPNYPNPFNPITTLRFSLKEKTKVTLVIYDAKGRLVRTLITPKKAMAAGKYRLLWDARDDKGFEVPSGQYFYRFSAGKYVKTRKMMLVK